MNKLILTLAILLPTAAMADDDNCEGVGELAQVVMEVRQSNVPISEVIKASPGFKKLILEAYKEPVWSAERNKKEAALKFRNKFELACYQMDLNDK